MKKFFTVLSVLLCFIVLGSSTVFATDDFNDSYTIEQFSEDLNAFFGENGRDIVLAPGETFVCDIPLSNGDVAKWECVAYSLEPQLFGTGTANYVTELGNNGFVSTIRYNLFGSFKHKIEINVTETSPSCRFKIYSNTVYDEVPAQFFTFVSSTPQTPVNYSSGNSSKADAYVTFRGVDLLNVNIYSRILANSYKEGIMYYTYYWSLDPFST